MTKTRHRLLRESKILQTSPPPENNMGQGKAITEEIELVKTKDNLEPTPSTSEEPDSPITTFNNSMSDAESHTTKFSSEISNTGSHAEGNLIVRKPRYTDNVPTGEKSSHSSKLSINSLRRRLGFKYSESCLRDIKSVMEHYTIAGSSTTSSGWTERRSGKAFLGISIGRRDERLPLPGGGDELQTFWREHSLILPGNFPTYCWKQINNNKLRPCHHGRYERNLGPLCQPRGNEKYRTMHSDIFSRIRETDINKIDTFGNSALHIAAALGMPPKEMLALLDLGPNIHVRNNAGQNFLHLVHEGLSMDCIKDMRALLARLQREGFDFLQRDHHGQTSLHLLTRPWIHKLVLREIMEEVQSSGIVLPTSRDNLGRTILKQLEVSEIGSDFLQQWLLASPTPKLEGHTRDPEVLHDHVSETKLKHVDEQCFPNYGGSTSIETYKDLQLYTRNANLLRVIRRAGIEPEYEDLEGRNGLHCLAEVSLDLPGAPFSSEMNSNVAGLPTPRQRYLEELLRAGVDPNSYDNRSITPIMAFIIYLRAPEDDFTIMPILSRLLDAGANIHCRNRCGEVPLHLALKLGRRAATKFLINHKANIHARNNDGIGLLALGRQCSLGAGYDETLYARIMLCIALLIDAGAVASPTILQEWATPSG